MTCPRHGLLTTPSPEGPAGGFKTSCTFSDAGLSGWSFDPCPLGWAALGNSLLVGRVLPCHVGHRKHRGFPLGRLWEKPAALSWGLSCSTAAREKPSTTDSHMRAPSQKPLLRPSGDGGWTLPAASAEVLTGSAAKALGPRDPDVKRAFCCSGPLSLRARSPQPQVSRAVGRAPEAVVPSGRTCGPVQRWPRQRSLLARGHRVCH